MFDFEKLEVYQVVKNQNAKVLSFLIEQHSLESYLADQLKKATVNIQLNLAEVTGHMIDSEKRQYLTMARSSVFESVATLDMMKGIGAISEDVYNDFYNGYEQASKMLLGMYRSYISKPISSYKDTPSTGV
jgi:four helix bundle protein